METLILKLKNKFKTSKKNLGQNLYSIALISVIIGLILAVLVLVKNLITTLKSSEKVILLKKEIASETFDINEFNQALNNLNKKIDPAEVIDWSQVKNIFLEPNKPQIRPAPISADELNNISPR